MQLVHEGKMHGFLRMYWAKKILEWSQKPNTALKTAQKLNDRFALDGNDPNGFVGVGWSIMGIHDQGWREREIFGKIRYMNFKGCQRKFNVQSFIDTSKARYGKGPGVYNYHTYIAHKLYREVLIVDEAQNLERFIQERESLRIWQHDIRYPSTAYTPEKMLAWAEVCECHSPLIELLKMSKYRMRQMMEMHFGRGLQSYSRFSSFSWFYFLFA